MATSTTTPSRSFAALDDRITRALAVLRRARSAAGESQSPDASRIETRAEENLNALLEHRSSVLERSTPRGRP